MSASVCTRVDGVTTRLPPYVTRELVEERLPLIFPEGIPNRTYCIRQLSASAVFAMLYIGAIADHGRYLGPVHVYRMSGEQASKSDDASRLAYAEDVLKKTYAVPNDRWYADNTREPIRDETLREGLVNIGTVIARDDLPTTSSKPRYALNPDFSALFDPNLTGHALTRAIAEFQEKHLSRSALARVSLLHAGIVASKSGVMVAFPNGETRRLAPGPSSVISKAVVEEFAPRFLQKPAILWLSESGHKVISRDDEIALSIGLKIESDKDLPDLILADLGPDDPLIVFVEVVATDGPISQRRQEALHSLTDAAGFGRPQVAFVTAFQDRSSPGFRKTMSVLAWNSFAWFVTEPHNVVQLVDGSRKSKFLNEFL